MKRLSAFGDGVVTLSDWTSWVTKLASSDLYWRCRPCRAIRRLVAHLGANRIIDWAFRKQDLLAVGRGYAVIRVGRYTAKLQIDTLTEAQRARTVGGERTILQEFLRHVRRGDVVFDVGANIGTHTLLFAAVVGPQGRVVAFEPEPGTRAKLITNVELNNFTNVTVRGEALSDQNGSRTLFVTGELGTGLPSFYRKGRAVEVHTAACDSFVSSGLLPQPNVVKIDVEGAEREVLLGMRQTLSHEACRTILCEFEPETLQQQGSSFDETIDDLIALGYARRYQLDRDRTSLVVLIRQSHSESGK